VNAHITELYNIRENNIKNVCFTSNNKLSAIFLLFCFDVINTTCIPGKVFHAGSLYGQHYFFLKEIV